ncbi:carbohydrate sulfotransferase 5-like [Protopterus annectens]|uniref:carbohydrate sulfotransferase 5-like n=1 Tax=Protopterus annectens TaxID=7888 RepID=UPI001CFA8B99|nr:carbohydrate sulfotransferase 5-like [Protopterus annectens]
MLYHFYCLTRSVIHSFLRVEELCCFLDMNLSSLLRGAFIIIFTFPSLVLILRYINTENKVSLNKEKQNKVHILILSSWRSGSSFIGQVFSQHPEVFYITEPSWHVWNRMWKNDANILQLPVRDLIRSVFQCDMSVYDYYLPEQKTKSNVFSWQTSRALCSPPACGFFQRTDIINDRDCKKICGKLNFSTVQEACQTYSHIAVKEVRLFRLESIYPLINDPALNLRIIHLVRDPRAVLNSREKALWSLINDNKILLNSQSKSLGNDSNYKVMETICRSQFRIHKTATTEGPSSLKNRYLVVRYEDVAFDPLGKVKEMYRFTNLNLSPKLESWIHDITHGSEKDYTEFQITSRDAQSISHSWRNKLSFLNVTKVQQVCKEAMDLFGYKLVSSEKELKSFSLDLVSRDKAVSVKNKHRFW